MWKMIYFMTSLAIMLLNPGQLTLKAPVMGFTTGSHQVLLHRFYCFYLDDLDDNIASVQLVDVPRRSDCIMECIWGNCVGIMVRKEPQQDNYLCALVIPKSRLPQRNCADPLSEIEVYKEMVCESKICVPGPMMSGPKQYLPTKETCHATMYAKYLGTTVCLHRPSFTYNLVEAKDYCEWYGGTLAQADDLEDLALFTSIQEASGSNSNRMWVGAEKVAGVNMWHRGEPVSSSLLRTGHSTDSEKCFGVVEGRLEALTCYLFIDSLCALPCFSP